MILVLITGIIHVSGRSRISRKGVHMYMYKGVGVRFADFISFFLNIPWKWNNLVSLRPNYLIFIGYQKMGDGAGVQANPSKLSGSATACALVRKDKKIDIIQEHFFINASGFTFLHLNIARSSA